MKTYSRFIFSTLLFTLASILLHAQTEKKTGTGAKVGDANSKTDVYQGKKIEQQSLVKPFEKVTDTIAPVQRKKAKKRKHKSSK